MQRWAAASRALVTAGAAVLVVGTLRPWVASGAVERTSYEMAALVERLGVAGSGPAAAALRGWSLVPLCAACAVAAAWWARWWIAAVAGGVAAIGAGAVAAAVRRADDVGVVRVLGGASVTLVGAVVLLAGAGACVGAARDVTRTTAPGPAAPA